MEVKEHLNKIIYDEGLEDLKLSKKQWQYIEDVKTILQVFYEAHLLASKPDSCLGDLIPLIRIILDKLHEQLS